MFTVYIGRHAQTRLSEPPLEREKQFWWKAEKVDKEVDEEVMVAGWLLVGACLPVN